MEPYTIRKVYKTGGSKVISLPDDSGAKEGDYFKIYFTPGNPKNIRLVRVNGEG